MSSIPTEDTLATESGIQTYLQNTVFASHTVKLLSGGSANFTYRIHLHVPIDGMLTFILKYAAPYVAASATTTARIPFSPERQVNILFHPGRIKDRALTWELNRDLKRKFSDVSQIFPDQMMTTW